MNFISRLQQKVPKGRYILTQGFIPAGSVKSVCHPSPERTAYYTNYTVLSGLCSHSRPSHRVKTPVLGFAVPSGLSVLLIVLLFASCNDFLDTPPDKRAVLDDDKKIAQILVSAYPAMLPVMAFELMSDNVTDNGPQYSDYSNAQLNEQAYRYEDITEPYWDAPKTTWEACYSAISSANLALEAIDQMDSPKSLNGSKAEALLCRAFGHFVLVNTFCIAYNPVSSDADMGIPYIEKPETTVDAKHERGTVASVYEKIDRDIEQALPLHEDNFREYAAYHFNRKAAFAFAARFNLFYGKWDKAAEYALVALGDDPGSMFRDYVALSKLPETEDIKNAYCNGNYSCNFLIIPQSGTLWGRSYRANRRYAHNRDKADETFWQYFPWNNIVSGLTSVWGSDQNVWYPKMSEFFEVTNPTAGIGYPHTVAVAFTVEETLACRAEAYVMMGEFARAVADLNIFYEQWGGQQFTQQQITNWYSTVRNRSPYVEMASRFNIQSGVQENLVRAVLAARRFENVHTGQRWLDVKRHGITVNHPIMRSQTEIDKTIVIGAYDKLTAIQLPAEVISAGLSPNPR